MRILVLFLALVSGSAWGNSNHCVMTIHREACPGKEAEAFAPYKGVNPTQTIRFTQTEAACLSAVERASLILRKTILKKITVTATFQESTLGPVSKEAECLPLSKRKLKR